MHAPARNCFVSLPGSGLVGDLSFQKQVCHYEQQTDTGSYNNNQIIDLDLLNVKFQKWNIGFGPLKIFAE